MMISVSSSRRPWQMFRMIFQLFLLTVNIPVRSHFGDTHVVGLTDLDTKREVVL